MIISWSPDDIVAFDVAVPRVVIVDTALITRVDKSHICCTTLTELNVAVPAVRATLNPEAPPAFEVIRTHRIKYIPPDAIVALIPVISFNPALLLTVVIVVQ